MKMQGAGHLLCIRFFHQGSPVLPWVPVSLTVQEPVVEGGEVVVHYQVYPLTEPPQLEVETA
ncbi:hypothetical protein DPMN_102752 [Dreissena polymorpha]|uniref:Uncharacterized protein n=1 Tax=Dreissena polymorpha TaxID=45954 RepID=A0A9D4BX40_DREPO|nr:hypothetical protein DPMN_069945 [Dreissena polymorpha]KAH3859931.1 hypothetical protein DPMN_102752 [Dreissena polymorpha]